MSRPIMAKLLQNAIRNNSSCIFRKMHISNNLLLASESQITKRHEPIEMSYNIYDSNNLHDGNRTPIIIMHGLFGSKSNWNSLSKAINNRTGRKVITVDARNHGESPHSDNFTYYHLVEDVNYLLKTMNLSKACFLGHSMGGRTMMLYSHIYPEKVDKLIVVDISHKSPGVEMTGMSKYFEAMRAVDLSNELSMPVGRKKANEQLTSYVQDADVRQFLLTNLVKDQNKFKWRLNIDTLEKVFSSNIIDFPLISSVFHGPTLFIGGTRSSYLRIEDEGEIKKIFSNVIFEYLDAGHWVHAEKPNDFLKLVDNFLL